MAIYLIGTNFVNKGAELMLHSVLREAATWGVDGIRIAGDPRHGTKEQRDAVGMHHFFWRSLKGNYGPAYAVNRALQIVPSGVRKSRHMVLEREVEAVLDGSGFRLSSQFSDELNLQRVKILREMKRAGKKLILLPQAFGPFESAVSRDSMLQVLEDADLIFARDSQSFAYLQSLGGRMDRVRQYPDFTNLCDVTLPEKYDFIKGRVLLVPNGRMLDRTSNKVRDNYIPFMIAVAEVLRSRGEEPLILIHSAESDAALAGAINAGLEHPIEIVHESDALKIKAMIGASKFMVGSRFHGVVSALCQATPALVAGWSHKYQELLRDYDSEEWLVDPVGDKAKVESLIDPLLDPATYDSKSRLLKARSAELKEKSREMWGIVRRELGV